MKIPIKTDIGKFFRQLVGLLSSIKPINDLRPREQDVLAEIMNQNYRLKDIKHELRHVVIFSTENRRTMCSNLGISEDTLNNNLSILRKVGVITKDNKLIPILNILPSEEYTLMFTFKIEEDDD
jgi:hypothetical protein